MRFLIITFLIVNFSAAQEKTNPQNQPIELGTISWYRNYDEALSQAKKQNKDVFILFQEVPGCATCRTYGKNVLSNKVLVETIENEFIPLAIFNNKGGNDRKVLQHFREPSWNNPVVRIVNSEGMERVQRIGGDYSSKTLGKNLAQALENKGTVVPVDLIQYNHKIL